MDPRHSYFSLNSASLFAGLCRRDGLAWADEEMKRGRSNHKHANGPPRESSLTRVGVIEFAVDSNLSGKLRTSVLEVRSHQAARSKCDSGAYC